MKLIFGMRMEHNRHAARRAVTVPRLCPLGLISFKKLEWTDHAARLVDFSKEGAGIESPSPLEPGFVLFRDRVAGNRGGVLLWSRQQDGRYRGGIRFLSLSPEQERCLNERGAWTKAHTHAGSAEDIIETLIRSMTDPDH